MGDASLVTMGATVPFEFETAPGAVSEFANALAERMLAAKRVMIVFTEGSKK